MMLGVASSAPRLAVKTRHLCDRALNRQANSFDLLRLSLPLRRLGLKGRNPDVVIWAANKTGDANPEDEAYSADAFELDELEEGQFLEEGGEEFDEGEFGAEGDDEFEEPTPEMIAGIEGEYEEDEEEEEARLERLRMAQEAASSNSSLPEAPERGYYLSDLFGKAAYLDVAELMETECPDAIVYGLQSNVLKIIPGDMYVCVSTYIEEIPRLVEEALSCGAAALLLPHFAQAVMLQAKVQEDGTKSPLIPPEIPCRFVVSVAEVSQRLAVAFYDAPARDMMVIGVIGSRGKTTVSWLICGILEAMEQVTGTVNSIGYSLSGELMDADGELWQAPPDDLVEEQESSEPFRITPYHPERYGSIVGSSAEPPSGMHVQKILAGMRDRGATCAVVECQDLGLAGGHHYFMDLSVAVHTNFTGANADALLFDGDKDQVLTEQLMMFSLLLDSSAQAAVINLDDPSAPLFMQRVGSLPMVTYGIDRTDADVVADSARFSIWESEVIIKTPMGKLQIISPLLGKHNVYNILAAVATGIALKVPLINIVSGIEAVEVIPGRCEVLDEGQEFSVIIDSANTPESLDAILSALRGNANNIFTVFGCQGERDKSIRPLMAEVAHAKSDFVIMTNDSPRREPPEQIIQDMVAGLPDEVVNKYSGYVYFPFQDQSHAPLWFEPYLQKAQRDNRRYIMEDRFSAIRAAIGTAAPGDVVVIAGRGHVDFMEYWDGEDGIVRGWLDDRVEARCALQKLSILQQLDGKLDRKTLPWGKALDQMDTIITA
ncbi:hypothetical protein CEUSTIGMA_g2109.t1 [Chlamydomonas eustigma]|uniref:Mur ligase central domain-containing protein n=1 Tax=Chlamydomonas eustigma TaxID=1157962 RepID=A0A250WV18_9CHLO|nr:hypothetical protein CEUSTIGMA_g2109.t1 [Chlamydomonas eustigma]|eukprot:GAX74661.1 hypothetical protein CEUSTIGMA_g2109.t1 [Chlamydomonas eustigma]